MTDPFPQLTSFLDNLLIYMIFVGILLAGVSAVVCGILYLPIFGLSERRREIAGTALRATVIGLLIVLLALPARAALLHFFPLPAGLPPVPVVPMTTPGTTPTPTSTAAPGS